MASKYRVRLLPAHPHEVAPAREATLPALPRPLTRGEHVEEIGAAGAAAVALEHGAQGAESSAFELPTGPRAQKPILRMTKRGSPRITIMISAQKINAEDRETALQKRRSKALSEQEEAERAVNENTARLRALRLAKEAEEQAEKSGDLA